MSPSVPWDDARLDAVEREATACTSGDACTADVLSLVAEVRRLRRMKGDECRGTDRRPADPTRVASRPEPTATPRAARASIVSPAGPIDGMRSGTPGRAPFPDVTTENDESRQRG